jgi:glycosyltransferase involved in cell wall biosynthesis
VTAGALALRIMRPRRARLVEDFHELYRESKMVPQRGVVGAAARAAVRFIENRDIPKADLVVVANPGTADYYARFGVSERLVVVENAPDLDRFTLAPQRAEGDPFRICFIGQKRYTAGLFALMEAIQPYPDMRALLAGGGVAEAEVAERAARYERIEVTGRVAYSEIPPLYRGCSAVFAVYDTDLGNVRTLFPVKVMEAMAVGVPVLVAEGTWIADYVTQHGLGYAVDGTDPASIEAALVALRDDSEAAREMGLRGRAIVEDELNWRAASERLVLAYRKLLT